MVRALLLLLLPGLSACAVTPEPPASPTDTPLPYRQPISPSARDYIVQKGDTLYSIGFRSGHGYQRLARWNNIAPPYKIYAGQKLRLTDPASDSAPSSSQRITSPVTKPPHNTHPPVTTAMPAVTKPLTTPSDPSKTASDHAFSENKKSDISIVNKKVLKLNWQWPVRGKIVRNFARTDKKGIDIASEIGVPIHAAEAGKVVYSGEGLIGYGNLLIIKHNETYLSAYGNNRVLLVQEGAWVEKGQPIAEMGLRMNQQPALHFEIRKNGQPVDPLDYLPR